MQGDGSGRDGMDFGLRGEPTSMRPDAGGSANGSAGDAGDPRASGGVAPPAPLTAIEAGRHRRLPLRVVEEAVVRQVARLTSLDALDLVKDAQVFFLDAAGKAVPLASVMVSWKE